MIAQFLGPLDCRQIDGTHWQLLSGLVFMRASGELVSAPTGFVTDFASTPQILWSLGMPSSGEYDAAAVIHDRMYQTHAIGFRPIQRAEADDVFYEAMLALGVWRSKAWLMWLGVRIGGAGPWEKVGKL